MHNHFSNRICGLGLAVAAAFVFASVCLGEIPPKTLPLPVEILDLEAKATQVYEASYIPQPERESYSWRVAALNRRFHDIWDQLSRTYDHSNQSSANYDTAMSQLEAELKQLQSEAPPSTADISDINAYNRRCLDYNRKVIQLKRDFANDVAQTNARMKEKQDAVEAWLKSAPIASTIQDGDKLLEQYKASTSAPKAATQGAPLVVAVRDPKTGVAQNITVDVLSEWRGDESASESAKDTSANRTTQEDNFLKKLINTAFNDAHCPALSGLLGALRSNRLSELSRRLEQQHDYIRKDELRALETIKFLRHYEITEAFEVLRNQGRCKDAQDLAAKVQTDPLLANDVAKIIAKANKTEQSAMEDAARHYDAQLRSEFRKIMGYEKK